MANRKYKLILVDRRGDGLTRGENGTPFEGFVKIFSKIDGVEQEPYVNQTGRYRKERIIFTA